MRLFPPMTKPPMNRTLAFLNRYKLPLLLASAAAVRLIVLLAFPIFAFDQTGVIHGSGSFDRLAVNLLETGVYGLTPGTPDAMLPPLYSYVLAGVYGLLGRGALQVGLFHIALDLLSITMLVEIGRRLMPRGAWVGWLAGVFYAFYPYLIFQNLTVIDTPLFMTLFYALILGVIVLRERERLDRGTWLLAIGCGVVLGLATLGRAILPPFALMVAVWFLFRRSLAQTVLRLLPVAVVCVAVLIPWIARNYDVYGTFVLMSVTAGSNLYQGNNPDVIPFLRAGYDVQWTSPDEDTPNTPEGDRRRTELALQYLRENPGDIPELIWVKLLTHWSIDIFPRLNPASGEVPRLDYQGDALREVDEEGDLSLGGLPEGDPVTAYAQPLFDQIGRAVHRVYFGVLFALALVGIALTLPHWRDVSLLWFVQISMTLIYVLFHPSTRYRVPTDPLLFLFSAYTIVWLWLKLRARGKLVPAPDLA